MRIERVTAGEGEQTARELVHEYMLSWGVDDITDPELLDELDRLMDHYGPPDGCTLVAHGAEAPLGVVAFKKVDEQTCEMKRMYVRPAGRRMGVGRALALALMDEARAQGYRRMRLDTPTANGPALAMYASIGFEPIPAYFDVPPDHPIQEWTCLGADLEQA